MWCQVMSCCIYCQMQQLGPEYASWSTVQLSFTYWVFECSFQKQRPPAWIAGIGCDAESLLCFILRPESTLEVRSNNVSGQRTEQGSSRGWYTKNIYIYLYRYVYSIYIYICFGALIFLIIRMSHEMGILNIFQNSWWLFFEYSNCWVMCQCFLSHPCPEPLAKKQVQICFQLLNTHSSSKNASLPEILTF